MAQMVYTNCYLSIGGSAMSASVKSVTINRNPDMLENTTMTCSGKSRKMGLDDWSFEVELVDNFTGGALDEQLWTVFDAGTTVAVIWRPDGGIIGVGNPSYTGTGIIQDYPLGGAVGTLATKKIKIIAAGTKLVRATS